MTRPKFSIIVSHYQGVDTDDELDRCIESIAAQTYTDYEVILMHDGELLRPCKYPIICSKERGKCWGHNLRHEALTKHAKGEYILHTNADNLYYPNALQTFVDNMEEGIPIYIMGCKMMGFHYDTEQGRVWYDIPRDYNFYTILRGTPVVGLIDLMQFCAKKELWDSIGGWVVTHETSDGIIYQTLCDKYPYKVITAVIGEHY